MKIEVFLIQLYAHQIYIQTVVGIVLGIGILVTFLIAFLIIHQADKKQRKEQVELTEKLSKLVGTLK